MYSAVYSIRLFHESAVPKKYVINSNIAMVTESNVSMATYVLMCYKSMWTATENCK